jgi:DNA-binding NtrC family response regulator
MPTLAPHLFTAVDRIFLQAVERVGYANPFASERREAERAALGVLFVDLGEAASPRGGPPSPDPNLRCIASRLVPILDAAHARLVAGAVPSDEDRHLYQEGCLHHLRTEHGGRLPPSVAGAVAGVYRPFLDDYHRRLRVPGMALDLPRPEDVFAGAFQIRRAYHQIFTTLIGTSRAMAALRAKLWGIIFSRTLRGYLQARDRKQPGACTLVTGPTGTGKELVARAIGGSSYEPFDGEQMRFVAGEGDDFCAVNLSALSSALFESELFGHERGAFTGAIKDRRGVFETVRPGGVVLLDEIGELGLGEQVKLLRVLQERAFRRVGDNKELPLEARIVSATHRDLRESIRRGLFRADFYHRIAGACIVTPSLREQLEDAPGDLAYLVRVLAPQIAPGDTDPTLADDALRYIEEHLPAYTWPGNVRELGDCIASVHHDSDFLPGGVAAAQAPTDSLEAGAMSERSAVRRYRNIVAEQTGNVSEAARKLGIHRSTLRRSLDRPQPPRPRRPRRPRNGKPKR